MTEEQDFEIIALNHPDDIKRMDAIDKITDFETLEYMIVADEHLIIRCKAFDRITELYGHKKKYKKMVNLLKEIDFLGWIPFTINELRKNNNIERAIKRIIHIDYTAWDPKKQKYVNIFIGDCVNVIFKPIFVFSNSHSYYNERDGIEIRYTDYGIQYHYEMIIRVLLEKENGELYYDYVFVRCWNTHPDAHKRFYKEIIWED